MGPCICCFKKMLWERGQDTCCENEKYICICGMLRGGMSLFEYVLNTKFYFALFHFLPFHLWLLYCHSLPLKLVAFAFFFFPLPQDKQISIWKTADEQREQPDQAALGCCGSTRTYGLCSAKIGLWSLPSQWLIHSVPSGHSQIWEVFGVVGQTPQTDRCM